jgi:hypothetical protein
MIGNLAWLILVGFLLAIASRVGLGQEINLVQNVGFEVKTSGGVGPAFLNGNQKRAPLFGHSGFEH